MNGQTQNPTKGDKLDSAGADVVAQPLPAASAVVGEGDNHEIEANGFEWIKFAEDAFFRNRATTTPASAAEDHEEPRAKWLASELLRRKRTYSGAGLREQQQLISPVVVNADGDGDSCTENDFSDDYDENESEEEEEECEEEDEDEEEDDDEEEEEYDEEEVEEELEAEEEELELEGAEDEEDEEETSDYSSEELEECSESDFSDTLSTSSEVD